MQLVIYRYCQERDRLPQELSIRTAWADMAPEPGQMVGMGLDRRWQVAQVYTFTPEAEVPVESVYLALIQQPDHPSDPSEWDCWKFRDLVPNENIYVHLEDVGLPELGIGFNCLGEPPQLGEQLFQAEATEGGGPLRPVLRPWQIDRCDRYVPAQTHSSPYREVYLAWCKAVAMELAAA